MKSLIDKNKKISKQRQEFVEHNFEAMVGARKRRYNETPQQKQRTDFLEDYYLLYTRNKNKWQKLKEWLEEQQNNFKLISKTLGKADYVLLSNCIKSVLSEMAKLEGEDE